MDFDTLNKENKINDTIQGVRKIWYLLAEGFYTQTNDYLHYIQNLNELRQILPSGWNLTLYYDGKISVYKLLTENKGTVNIEKEKDGKESVMFHS